MKGIKMKQVKAIIKHERLEAVRDALDHMGVKGITITEVKGAGQQRGYAESYRGAKTIIHFRPKIEVVVVVNDLQVDEVVEAILNNAHTGDIGDGKIFVIPVEEIIKIRTGERGSKTV